MKDRAQGGHAVLAAWVENQSAALPPVVPGQERLLPTFERALSTTNGLTVRRVSDAWVDRGATSSLDERRR